MDDRSVAQSTRADASGPGWQARPFWNLYQFDKFRAFNFNNTAKSLRRQPDPSSAVAQAFRIRPPHRPDPHLISTLSFTLSPESCFRFHAAPRDYFLSKLFQFLYLACLDESMDAAYHETVEDNLADALSQAFPEGSPHLSNLWLLDWHKIIEAYVNDVYDTVLSLPSIIKNYLPQSQLTTETPAQVIDRLARRYGWPMEQLAQQAGIGVKQVYKVKNRQDVRVSTIIKLATALNCPPGFLIDVRCGIDRTRKKRSASIRRKKTVR